MIGFYRDYKGMIDLILMFLFMGVLWRVMDWAFED